MATDRFLREGSEASRRLGLSWPQWLMVMNLESGISPRAGCDKNQPAVGIIQFYGLDTLRNLGWTGTREEFCQLADYEQLPFAVKFMSAYAPSRELTSTGRIHQAMYVPATLDPPFSRSPSQPITARSDKADDVLPRGISTSLKNRLVAAYNQNRGFDRAGKGYITVQDLEDTDVAAAARSGSPFQVAFARLKALGLPTNGGGTGIKPVTGGQIGLELLAGLGILLGAGVVLASTGLIQTREERRRNA